MRSGITNRWLRGSLFLTVLLVLLVESMFVYNFQPQCGPAPDGGAVCG